jgi:hypothetical protein
VGKGDSYFKVAGSFLVSPEVEVCLSPLKTGSSFEPLDYVEVKQQFFLEH